jgi:hypothetical protein
MDTIILDASLILRRRLDVIMYSRRACLKTRTQLLQNSRHGVNQFGR